MESGTWSENDFLMEMRRDTERSLVVFVNEISTGITEEELLEIKRRGVKKEGAKSVALVKAAEQDYADISERVRVLREELDILKASGMEKLAERFQIEVDALAKTAERATGRSVRAGETAAVDPKTGLATGQGLLDADAKLMMRIWKGEEGWAVMEDTVEIVMDMMLFHRGVEELGEGFDDRIKMMAGGLISIAEYLADGEEGIYSEMDDEAKKENEALNLYFPEGSDQRGWLDELKKMGIKFEPGRLNPGGGDEFIMRIDLNVRSEPMRKRLGERRWRLRKMVRVMDWVINNTTFSKERPVILGDNVTKEYSESEEAERLKAFTYFRNCINEIVPKVNEQEGVSSEQSSFCWKFKNSLRSHLGVITEEFFQPGDGLLDPSVDLRMDYCQVGTVSEGLPVMEEVVAYFEKNRPLGDHGSNEYEEFVLSIKKQLAEELDEEEIRDGDKTRNRAEELVYRAVFDKYQRSLFGEVNRAWKGRKKMEVMTKAMRGDPQAIYVVGSVESSQRTFLENVGDGDLKEMWINVMRYWMAKKERGEVDQDPEFKQFLEEMGRTVNGGREFWRQMMGVE